MAVTKAINKVSIDGKYLNNFEHLTLKQSINNHHFFKLIVDHDEIEALGSHTLDASKAWLGKSIVISFDETEFLGIITQVRMAHRDGHEGVLIVTGYSKTILLEGGNHTRSWMDKNLSTIVKDVIEETAVEAEIKPVRKGVLQYEAQYGESSFKFLQRLSKQHNEWLFYDGTKLVFGKPTISDTTTLEYGSDLNNISVGMAAKANSLNVFSYHSLSDTRNEAKAKDNVEGLNELGMEAFNVSLDMFPNTPSGYSIARVENKSELENSIQKKQAATVADLNVLEADCNKQNLTVGSIVKIRSARLDGKASFDEQSYGDYLIIAIVHKASSSAATYSCHFKAIPAGVAVLPEPLVALPQANPQIATVVSNEDPEGKGRVKVQLNWQKHEMTTNWIRVLMPDAGASENNPQNRGHVFIPEEGDQVMVGFRYADPNRPFVMGGVFHGQNGVGGDLNNKIKSITTRSGNSIVFDDDNSEGSITISDPSGNTVTLNGDGTMSLSAPSSITVTSKEINLLGENKVHIESKEVTVVGTNKIGTSSDTLIEMASPKISTSSDATEINAKMTVDIEGKTMTNVKGAIVNLN